MTLPATIGARLADIATPALLVDLDAFDFNLATLAAFVNARGIRLRAHAKTHKSADIARRQIETGGACGICCQKVSEAEAFVDAGVTDILVSNQVAQPQMIERLARLATRTRMLVCVDDAGNVDALSRAAAGAGASLECLVEIDVGSGRCGVAPDMEAVSLAKRISTAPGLKFAGLQAYHGRAQHIVDHAERTKAVESAIGATARVVQLLKANGLDCTIVGGAGTGTYEIEGASGVFNELQCGSYIFMDAHYQRIRDAAGAPLDRFKNSLFVYTSIMSKTKSTYAVCDAGLKAQSVDSGPPVVFGRNDVEYLRSSDEHGIVSDPGNRLRLNERLLLVPGHCDPTVNLYDWLIGFRGERVEAIWPVTARGRLA